MKPDRRHFLQGSAAALALASTPAQAALPTLRAAPSIAQITSRNGPKTPVWSYEGSIPGPPLRLPQGATLRRRFENGLDQPSTVHWHGIRIDNAMDGVAGLTQDAVPPGTSFDYAFTVPDAGTYWYHPHHRTFEQMARGLYGPLIVEEPAPPEVDHDLPMMLDDWRLSEDGSIHPSFGQMHDWSHAGRIGNWVTVNGNAEWILPAKTGERFRLRFINAANARVFRLGLQGLSGWLVALDGQPLAQPKPADAILLGPSQRADVILDIVRDVEEALVYSIEQGEKYVVAAFPVAGQRRATPLPAPDALPPNPVVSAEGRAPDHTATLDMRGGAMGQMQEAMLDGKTLGIRDLVREGYAWAFNGTAGMPDTPLVSARRDEVIHIRIANDTRWPHAIHLHGHHFQEINKDGTYGPFLDTLLFQRGETRRIAFVADNPGQWLLHCHMLEHAAAGMMTWIDVA